MLSSTLASVRLQERDDDLAGIATQLERARAGHGSLVVVKGESGAGKSALLQAFLDALAADGSMHVPVLSSACDPLSTPRPLGPIHDLADELGEVVRAALDGAEQPHEIFAAVFEHLRANPLVLVVDDLHWADQGTIDLLRYVLRRIRITQSLVIVALRDDEVGPTHRLRALLGDIARSADATSISLQPLSVDAIGALAPHRADEAARLREITGGNAFYVTEMLDHDGDDLPGTVRDAILARTTNLSREAWDLLHLLACAPEAIPDPLLAALGVGLPPLRDVGAAGLVRRGTRGVTFRHDLCRLAVASTIPPGGEPTFHRRMLTALEASSGPDPAVLAHHAMGAGDAARTLQHATAAARAAARSGAHTQAAAFYRTALDHGGPHDEAGEATLLELLADECYLIDRLDDAIAASDHAMRLRWERGNLAGVSGNHRALSVYHWYSANRATAAHHASAAVTVLDASAPSHTATDVLQLGHGLATQAYLDVQNNSLDSARTLLARAAEINRVAADRALELRLRLTTGILDVMEGRDGSRESTLSILEGHEQLDEIYSSGYSNLTYLDVEQRRLRKATELLGYSLPITVERDLPICYVWQMGSRGRLKLMQGRWDDALVDADIVLSGPGAPLARTWPHLLRGLVALRRGNDAPAADADLDAAWTLAHRFAEPMRLLPAAAAIVERSWLTGEEDDRLDACRALLDSVPRRGLDWARGELAVWLQRLDGSLELERAGEIAEPHRLALTGDPAGAAVLWAELGDPYERALALVDTGDTDQVRAGLDVLDGLGADAVAAKVRQDLRRRGTATIPSRRRASTRANPGGLTNRQVEILQLLRDGSTNAEIAQRLYLSTKTVDHHVSALLAKLHVSSRRDAVRRGIELGIMVA